MKLLKERTPKMKKEKEVDSESHYSEEAMDFINDLFFKTNENLVFNTNIIES